MVELDRLCGSYFDLLWHFDPAAASAAGSVSEDGRLGQFDAQAMRQHIAAFRAITAALEDLEIDPLEDEIDRTALLDDVRATVARLEEDRPQIRDPGFWVSHLSRALATLLLRSEDEGPPGQVAHDAAARIAAIPALIESARRTLRRPPAVLADAALAALGPAGELLVHAAARFAVEAPGGPDALNPAVAAALEALTRFGHWLCSEVELEPGAGGAGLGVARYERRLQLRYAIRSGGADLWRHAAQLIDETTAALEAQAAALGSRPWRAQLAELESGDPDPVPRVRAAIDRAREQLPAHGFPHAGVEGPVVLASPTPLAAILPGVTYLASSGQLLVAPPLPGAAAIPLIVAELLPGRHLQERAARELGSGVRRRLRTPVAVEGWALYVEELVDQLDWLTPESRLVRLARLLRAGGRLAADVGVHAREMGAAEAMTLLVERGGFAPPDAARELPGIVARPTDAAAAGRRELLALRSGAGVRVDAPAALARFHSALLGYGGLAPRLAGWGMGIER